MDITFLGHSSFKLKGKSGSVVTDPFDPQMVGLTYHSVDADIVTVSHDHNDHNQISLVRNVKKVISGPGEYEILGISIIGFSSFHDDKEGSLRGKNTIYVFEIDGLRLSHLGDLGHNLSEELVEDLGDIDILMVPVGGEYTIGPDEATGVVQSIEPSIVIPMHFAMQGLRPETFSKLTPVDSFLKEVGLMSENLPKLVIKKEELGEDQKVVVLEKK
ncbi:MBL fold metallo-hydrolase [Candidatus Woesebacteria bacterium]|nr:MBL fold metallo-hydrolase [Candidatus Woesebacteria bacterium]